MGMPDHLTCLLRNLYAGQETTVRTGHGTTGWFQIRKGVCQSYILYIYVYIYNDRGWDDRWDDRGWDGWMASPTQWTWVWVNSGSWWWTGRPGVLRFMGLQRVGHNWVTELNWTERKSKFPFVKNAPVGPLNPEDDSNPCSAGGSPSLTLFHPLSAGSGHTTCGFWVPSFLLP